MKHLLIVGARGWGREVYHSFMNTKLYLSGDCDVKGFLDSKSDALSGLRGEYPPIICSPEEYEIEPDDVFFIAMGDSKWRKHYAELIESKGGTFISIIHPLANVYSNAIIGEGSFIGAWTNVSDNVTLGKHTIIHSFSILGHDVVVGDYSTLLSYVFLGGYVQVGECSTLNPKSMIIPHKKIGNNVSVGSSSVVMRNVKDNLSVHGNPAVKIEL